MYYVYVLFSLKDYKLYVGYTGDLKRRISEHSAGFSTATKERRPLKLIYYEAYLEELEAKRRERYLKGGNGRAQLKIQLSYTLKKFGYKFIKNSGGQEPRSEHPALEKSGTTDSPS
jgi:putative endonuclease